MNLKNLQKFVKAVNTYYSFALIVYAAALFASSHSVLFIWVLITGTPLLTAWGGYLLSAYLRGRNERHGFRILADVMTYEVGGHDNYTLRYTTKLQARTDYLMVYPISYQWSGEGDETIPHLTNPGQQLLAVTKENKNDHVTVTPYTATSTQGDWHYWFVAFNPPINKNEIAEVRYSQEFHDDEASTKPRLYYFVRVPMKRLELNVKFPGNRPLKSVTFTYSKPSNPRHNYPAKNIRYDPDKEWATWAIDKPKKGYCYRIQWQR